MPIITSTSFKCASKPQSEDMLIVGGFTCVENWREGNISGGAKAGGGGEGRKDMFYLTTHSTYFIYGYMASDGILFLLLLLLLYWSCLFCLLYPLSCCHMDYSFRLTARVILYAPSHRQDNTYHGLCYSSC